jgi:predicted amidohydrolase YtcJ
MGNKPPVGLHRKIKGVDFQDKRHDHEAARSARVVPGRALVNARIFPMGPPADPQVPGALAGGAQGSASQPPWERRAQAILWEGDTIVTVGDDAEIRDAAARRGIKPEDAAGRLVLPGFVDAHMHFLHQAIKHSRPDLRGAKTKRDALSRVSAWLRANPGSTAVVGEGWDESDWPGRAQPTREELDRIGGARPLVLRRIDGHVAVASTTAAQAVERHFRKPGAVDAATGILLEEASLYLNEVFPAPDAELDAAVVASCRLAHSLGVTALGDYSQAPFRAALVRAARRGTLSVHVASSIYVQQFADAVAAGFRTGRVLPGDAGPSPWFRDGGLKVFLDGSLGAHTAALREPYAGPVGHPHPKGKLNWTDAEVARLFADAHENGVQIHAHAIGDAAIEQGLDAFSDLAAREDLEGAGWGSNAARHRFEHFEIVGDDQLRRTAELGVVASSQPNFVGAWSAKGGMYEDRLGERFRLNNRFRTMKSWNIPLAFGSDGMPFEPRVGLQAAVAHPDTAERLTPMEAVWHYTWMAAWSLHWEHEIGSLETGKKADLVILDAIDPESAPKTWHVRETIAGGVTRFPGPA